MLRKGSSANLPQRTPGSRFFQGRMKNNRLWFKVYSDMVLDDDRLGDMPVEYFKIYVQIYALCNRYGDWDFLEKNTRQIAKRLSFSTELMEKALHALEAENLIEVTPTGVRLVMWDMEQSKISDAERQRAYRLRKSEKNPALN